MDAGRMRDRLRFEKRATIDDGAGNRRGDFQPQFTVAASVVPNGGGEEVLASRLGGVQPVTITIRRTVVTLGITAAWRAVDERTGTVYAITAPPRDPDGQRQWLEIVGTSGVAA